MRIISGHLKGMALTTKISPTTRPTSDAVRETIFNLLQTRCDLEGARIVDLYAGTGALGIECISRGAIHCDFVDSNKQARKTIQENIDKALSRNVKEKFTYGISKESADVFIKSRDNQNNYDIVFADPPYINDLKFEMLNLVKPQGLLIYETSITKLEQVKLSLKKVSREVEIEASRKMGKTAVVVVRAL